MDFKVLVKKRRGIQDYKDKEVPLEIVKEIIGDCCQAPSANNGQPWQFMIVNDRSVMKTISDDCKKTLLAGIMNEPNSPLKAHEPIFRDPNFNVFYNAPCLIYIAGPKDAPWLQVDCTLAACYLMFSAVEKGLGTRWIGAGRLIQDLEIRQLIGLPADSQIVASIILGYPKVIPETAERMEPRIIKIISPES